MEAWKYNAVKANEKWSGMHLILRRICSYYLPIIDRIFVFSVFISCSRKFGYFGRRKNLFHYVLKKFPIRKSFSLNLAIFFPCEICYPQSFLSYKIE